MCYMPIETHFEECDHYLFILHEEKLHGWDTACIYIQNISIACIRAHCIRYFRTSKLHNIEHNESICKLVKGTQLVVSFQCDTYETYSVHGPYIYVVYTTGVCALSLCQEK